MCQSGILYYVLNLLSYLAAPAAHLIVLTFSGSYQTLYMYTFCSTTHICEIIQKIICPTNLFINNFKQVPSKPSQYIQNVFKPLNHLLDENKTVLSDTVKTELLKNIFSSLAEQ